jgi:hypothetical protein
MYIADLEYHYYEARLTREMQDEGFVATAVNLGLTGSAALIPVAQTSRQLAGIATGVTGLDKAYSDKLLLSNTIQALQTQMRADRKAEAAVIYAKMFKDSGGGSRTITPIAEYTLPMALSDVDAYYQAGTIASALIGLSKTVAGAEQRADEAKTITGPNPTAVSLAKTTAAVVPPLPIVFRQSIPSTPRAPLPRTGANPPLRQVEPTMAGLTETENGIPQSSGEVIQTNLCISTPATSFDSARDAIQQAKIGAKQITPRSFTNTENRIVNAAEVQMFLNARSPPCVFDSDPSQVGYRTAYEKFRFPDEAAVTALQQILKVCDERLGISGKFDAATRDAIAVAKGKINQALRVGLTDLTAKTLRANSFLAIQRTCR